MTLARSDIHDLVESWRQWTAAISLFVKSRDAYRRVDPEAYRQLHQAVLEGCRRCAAAAEPHGRGAFEKLGRLAAPWISTEGLRLADRDILGGLLAGCRAARDELSGGRITKKAGRWMGGLLTAVAAFGLGWVVLGMMQQAPDPDTPSLNYRVQSFLIRMGYVVRSSTVRQRVYVVGPVVVLAGIWFVRRSARNY